MLVNILDRGIVVSFDEVFFHGLVRIAAPFIDVFAGIQIIVKTCTTVVIIVSANKKFVVGCVIEQVYAVNVSNRLKKYDIIFLIFFFYRRVTQSIARSYAEA